MAFQAGAIVSQLTLDRSKFSASVKAVQKQTRRLGGWVKQNSAQFKRMGIAAAAAGTAALVVFTKMVKKYVEVGDMVHKMALRTGFAATTLSELAYAADISGADLTMLEKGVKKMSKTIVDASYGLETYLRVFRSLGLDINELLRMEPEEQFLKIGAAIADMESDTLRTAAAVDVFGRSGTMLLPLFKEGAEGIEKLRKEAHKLGIIFDEEAAAKAAKLKDAQTALKGSVQGLSIAILNDLIPVLTDVTKQFTEFFVTSREDAGTWTNALVGFFKIVAKGIEGLTLAWHGMQVIIFKGAEFIAKAIKFQIDALTAPLNLLAKLPGYGEIAKIMLKGVAQHTADLTAISDEYNKEAAKQIENLTDLVVGFDKFFAVLDKISEGLKTSKEGMKGLGEVIVESVLPAAREMSDVFDMMWGSAFLVGRKLGDIMGQAVTEMESHVFGFEETFEETFWKIYQKASLFTSSLSSLFNQMTVNQMANIDKEYQAREKAIQDSLMNETQKTKAMERLDAEYDKKKRKAARAGAARTKAIGIMESIIHTASAVAEALPDWVLAIAVGIMGAAQTALIAGQTLPALAKGGRLGRGEPAIVGERGSEIFVPDAAGTVVPLREGASMGGLRPIYLTIAPNYQISTIDEIGVRDFMRIRGLPAIVEAIKVGIMKPELQDALRIK